MHESQIKSGMVALPGLLEVIEAVLDDCETIEIEPQTFWRQDEKGNFSVDKETLLRIKSWGKPISLHGVGTPIGGTKFSLTSQLRPLLKTIELLEPLWITEHLSFNRCPDREYFTGFFLPPIQTLESVEIAANNLLQFRELLGIPVGFETGVNYFPKQEGQLSDGQFFNAVAELADCGILLDIHNLWCNERNGRESINDVLSEISLDRVLEVHIAGGDSFWGYYLDSHSRLPDQYLIDVLTTQILPKSQNIRSIIFEITSTNFMANEVSIDKLGLLLKQLKDLQIERIPENDSKYELPSLTIERSKTTIQTAIDWEKSIVDQVFLSREEIEERQIPGIELYRKLIDSNRLGALSSLCTLCLRLSVKILGSDKTKKLFQDYIDQSYPEMTSEREAKRFVEYMNKKDNIPLWFMESLVIDMGRVEASTTLENVRVQLSIDPNVLFSIVKNGLTKTPKPDGKNYYLELQP